MDADKLLKELMQEDWDQLISDLEKSIFIEEGVDENTVLAYIGHIVEKREEYES